MGERLFWQEKSANRPETGITKPRKRVRAGGRTLLEPLGEKKGARRKRGRQAERSGGKKDSF
jgi:hypothetical protein